MPARFWKCPECGEKYKLKDIENGDVSTYYCERTGVEICDGCREQDEEHASTIVRFNPNGEKEIVHFGDYVTWTDSGDDTYDWFTNYFGGRKWVSTDAWRGYFDSTFTNGFVKLADGWVTGWIDETIEYKRKSVDFKDYVEANPPPAPLYWLFEPTSNIFSTATEVFVDKADRPAIKRWMKKGGLTIEDLEEGFS